MNIPAYTRSIVLLAALIAGASFILFSCSKDRDSITVEYIAKIKLGKLLFNDKNLSSPAGQSCSSCHSSATGFSDPNHMVVAEGAVSGLFGNRNAPNIAYTMFTPPLQFDNIDSTWVGGFFLDGRENTLEQQAKSPFLNPLEMNNSSIAVLLKKLRQAGYYSLYKEVFGEITDSIKAFNNIATAIAAFERSPDLNPFTSKYDYYLKGQATLTAAELRGLQLFIDEKKGKCGNCHIADPDPVSGKILFTDFTYDNIGVPKNPANPFYSIPTSFNPLGSRSIDYGLGGFLSNRQNFGQFKVPTLRNAAVSGPYFHNGFFKTLDEVVHFYNKRDVEPFPSAELPGNVNHDELGDLQLTPEEEKDIVAFIKTLTDGFK